MKISPIIFILLLLVFCAPEFTLADTLNKQDGQFYIYTYQYKEIENTSIVKNGANYIISCPLNLSKSVLHKLNKSSITGVSAEFRGTMQSTMQLKNALKLCIVYEETLENTLFIYGYSPAFREYTTYNNYKINVQIAYKDDTVKIGVPLILGSI